MYHEILRSGVVRSCLMGRGYGAGLGAGSPHLLAIAALKQVCNHPRLVAPKVLKASQSMMDCGDAENISDGVRCYGLWCCLHNYSCDFYHKVLLFSLSIILTFGDNNLKQNKAQSTCGESTNKGVN